jgi:hypothetical protein
MTNIYRPDPIFLSAYTNFQGFPTRERIITGTALDVIKKETPEFYYIVENSVSKNRLNDPFCTPFTVFAPLNIDEDILDKYHEDTLVSHSMLQFVLLPSDKDVMIEMMDGHVCRVKNDMIDGRKIIDTIQCSNGVVNIIENILEPKLLSAFGVY